MERELSKGEMILGGIVFTHLIVAVASVVIACIDRSVLQNTFFLVQPILLFLHDYALASVFVNLGMMLVIAFFGEVYSECMDNAAEENAKKYVQLNNRSSNTKARLELVNLRSKEGA